MKQKHFVLQDPPKNKESHGHMMAGEQNKSDGRFIWSDVFDVMIKTYLQPWEYKSIQSPSS